MDWKRESEFRRLLSAQIKHLTKEGLETLAHIATTDMAEVCFQAIHTYVFCGCVRVLQPRAFVAELQGCTSSGCPQGQTSGKERPWKTTHLAYFRCCHC